MRSTAAKSALMLVPEIALTPVFSRRLRAVFGIERRDPAFQSFCRASVMTSGGESIAARPASLSARVRPSLLHFEILGLVIVDEEHDASYRQHESPFYHARDVAVMRANFRRRVVVLGSATPLSKRFTTQNEASTNICDLPKSHRRAKTGRRRD